MNLRPPSYGLRTSDYKKNLATCGGEVSGSNPLAGLASLLAASRRRTAAIAGARLAGFAAATVAGLVAAIVANTVAKAAQKAGAFAAVVAALGARDLLGRFLLHPLAAGHGLFVRRADANRTGALARNLLGFAHGVLFNAFFLDALNRANLNLLFLPYLLANRNLALDVFGHADLLAHRHWALFVLGAVHPHLAGASRTARIIATLGSLAGIAAATEQAADFLALPVPQANELLLHAGFLDVLVGGLLDDAVFMRGHVMADLAGFFLPDRNAFDATNGAFLDDGDLFAAEGVVRFSLAFDLVRGPLGRIRFAHPLRTSHGAKCGGRRARRRSTGVTTTGRPKICPNGRNRHGGNGANQQSQTKRLAHHAFSLVIHADPVIPNGHARLVRIDTE